MSRFALFIYLFVESDSKRGTHSFVGLEASTSCISSEVKAFPSFPTRLGI